MPHVDTSTSQLSAHELHLEARRRRSQVAAELSYHVVSKLAAWVHGLAYAAAELARRWATERRLRREMRRLARLGDRELADVGVARGEIDHLVRYGRR